MARVRRYLGAGTRRTALAGRFGVSADDSGIRNADAIVILPGLLGDNRVMRTRDLAVGLRRCGFHVLALELRGHGLTDQRTPQAPIRSVRSKRWICLPCRAGCAANRMFAAPA